MLSVKMFSAAKPRFDHWILVLITGFPPKPSEIVLTLLGNVTIAIPLYRANCPDNIDEGTSKCLSAYKTQLRSLEGNYKNLYTGADVETIRLLCHAFKTSVRCANDLKKSCPDTEHTYIESAMEDLISMAELCQYPRLYEEYARYQNCYARVKPSSDRCYQKFLADTDSIAKKVLLGEQSAVGQLCRFLDTLLICVKNIVRPNCGLEAANLVDILVKPSVKSSQHCRNDSIVTTTSQPTKPGPQTRASKKTTLATIQVGPFSMATHMKYKLTVVSFLTMISFYLTH